MVLVLVAFFAWWVLKTDYSVLFSDLSPQDAVRVTKELEKHKIDYVLTEDGSSVLVDSGKVHQSRIALMSNGTILDGNIGFEIFDKSDMGMTEYSQKINYQRALQGELARSISSLDSIKFARVHLVLPQSSLFKRKTSKPKASVGVSVKSGEHLNQKQIGGIQRLVAAAVPDLVPEKVIIVDQHGVTLSGTESNPTEIQKVGDRFELKKQVEINLVGKAKDVLDRTFGPGNAVVSVDVALNMDQIKRTTENILPVDVVNGKSLGLVVKKRQNYQAKPRLTQTASIGSEIPGTRVSATNSSTEIEYKYGKSLEQIVSTPGSIKRLSVGVLVPGNLNEQQLGELKEIVAMAIGLDKKRGDGIAVYPLNKFNSSLSARPDTGAIHSEVDSKMEFRETMNIPEKPSHTAKQEIGKIIQDIQNNPFLQAGAFSIVAIILIMVWYLLRVTSAKKEAALSDDQREKMLQEIRQWIDAQESEGSAS